MFPQYVVYNPESVTYEHENSNANAQQALMTYPSESLTIYIYSDDLIM